MSDKSDDFDGDKGLKNLLPDFVRKMAVTGLGAVFMTEDGIRALGNQLKLPKEALGFVMSQAERSKEELTRVLSEELRRFLQSEKLREEFLKLLKGMTLEVKAEVRLVDKGGEDDADPQVTVSDFRVKTGGPRRKK